MTPILCNQRSYVFEEDAPGSMDSWWRIWHLVPNKRGHHVFGKRFDTQEQAQKALDKESTL